VEVCPIADRPAIAINAQANTRRQTNSANLARIEITNFSSLTQSHAGKKKAPRDTLGDLAPLFLAKSAQPLRHRRVAWLTAFQPLTVAGPRPIFTAFPAAHACKLKIECMSRLPMCQRLGKTNASKFFVKLSLSDSSNLVCASPPAPASPPANPPTGTIHSEKCSWNFSNRLLVTSPCHQESPFLPSSTPARNGC